MGADAPMLGEPALEEPAPEEPELEEPELEEPIVLEPMLLEPIDVLPGDMVLPELEELEVPVEGLVEGGTTVVFVVSSFLPQAPSASKAASATDVRARDLCRDVNIRFPLDMDRVVDLRCAATAW